MFGKTQLIAVAGFILLFGAGSFLFSGVRGRRSSPQAGPGAGRLVAVWGTTGGNREAPVSAADLSDWRSGGRVFEQVAAYVPGELKLAGAAGAGAVPRASVSADFFSLLGVTPSRGRDFHPEEDRPGRERVVILSHGLWRGRFAADPLLVGKSINLNDESYTVVGVMPEGFQFPARAELWTPLALDARQLDRSTRFLHVVARLKPGVSLDEARTQMSDIARRLQQQYPETNQGWGVSISPLDIR